jgi:hypothetical protein
MSKSIRFETKKMQTAIAAVPAINEIVEKQTKKENKVIEPLTWEQLFLFFPVLDPIFRANLFLQVADAYFGEQVKTKKQLEELTGVKDSQTEGEETYSLFLTGRVQQYTEALEKKIRTGTTWKELLSLDLKSFALPAPPWEGRLYYSGKWKKEKVIADAALFAFGVERSLNRGILVGVTADALEAPYKLLLSYAVELTGK